MKGAYFAKICLEVWLYRLLGAGFYCILNLLDSNNIL